MTGGERFDLSTCAVWIVLQCQKLANLCKRKTDAAGFGDEF